MKTIRITESKLIKIISKIIKEHNNSYDKFLEEGAKPDFLDLDKDGDKKESMKKAAKEVKEQNMATNNSSGFSQKQGSSDRLNKFNRRQEFKEDAEQAFYTQKVTGQEAPHDEDDMAPDGMGDDSDIVEEELEMGEAEENVNEIVPLIARAVGGALVRKAYNYFKEDEGRTTFNVDEETDIEGVDDAGSALDTMSYVNPDAEGFQSLGPMDSYGEYDDEEFV